MISSDILHLLRDRDALAADNRRLAADRRRYRFAWLSARQRAEGAREECAALTAARAGGGRLFEFDEDERPAWLPPTDTGPGWRIKTGEFPTTTDKALREEEADVR